MTIHQIKKFEKQNPDILVNVIYHYSEGQCLAPSYCTKYKDRKHVVTRLLIHDDDNEDSHFVLVRDMDG